MPKVGVNFRRRSPLRRGQFCTPVYRHLLKDDKKDAELALRASRDLFG